jgi:acetylornithine/succinyldiaminopimelate/putrescine aminotransferase/predicted amino acid dehydrogenase
MPVRAGITRTAALAAFGLDVAYERGEGDMLFSRDSDGVGVWDFLGGYGSTFFGHNHPSLAQTMVQFLSRGGVIHSQASVRPDTEALRCALADRLLTSVSRAYEIVFGSTGAEAVEIAAKHSEMAYAARSSAIAATLLPDAAPAQPAIWTDEARTLLVGTANGQDSLTLTRIAEWNARVLEALPVFIAVRRSFHGMTSRALELTDDAEHRFGYRAADARYIFVSSDDPDELRDVLSRLSHRLLRVVVRSGGWHVETVRWTSVAAFFIEPIQGEGGIHPISPETAQVWQAACAEHDVPLIADEIQSGLGRTGSFLFSEQLGIRPDYVLLGKSLGGGLTKISAVAIARARGLEGFALQHSSTFAEDDLSARVALRALELLDSEVAPRRARLAGERLLQGLRDLASRYPDVVAAVRGHGLMLGMEWRQRPFDRTPALRFLQRYGWLGYAYSGYLLRQHRVRVAPALSMGLTLRFEPSYSIPEIAITQLLEALDELCRLVLRQDAGAILGPCIGVTAPPESEPAPSMVCRPARVEAHVGFVGHFIDAHGVALWDPTLGRLGDEACVSFLDHMQPFAEPLVYHRDDVHSATDSVASVTFVGIPVDSQQCYDALRAPQRRELCDLVQRAVDLAVGEGCTIVGLGGYCSILTRNGRTLEGRGAVLTTGNSHSAAVGLQALDAAARDEGIDPATAHAAVLGATGNIGSVLAELLARDVAAITLIGRTARRPDLEALANRIRRYAHARRHDIRIFIASDPTACRDAQLVVTSSNSPAPILHPHHFGDHATVALDIAVPGDVHPAVMAECPTVRVLRGGVVRLPRDSQWYVPGIPLDPGTMFACMAEAVLMGLDGARHDGSLGALSVNQVVRMAALASKHGFAVPDLKRAAIQERSFVYSL